VSISYGATEMQGGMVECAPGSGYHNPAPDQFYIEVADPQTGAPLGEGREGLVLLTHLRRTGTVLLRYALGDVSVLSRERCRHCGSWTDRLTAMPHRIDRLVKIKGTLVNPDVLVAAAESVLGSGEFQFSIRRGADGADVLLLTVAGKPRPGLAERVKAACGVTPVVEVAALDLAHGWKAKRVVDRRS
jgi:phenylacetate-CoA ligase